MMESTPELAIADLLRETEAAHGAYEKEVLGGEFDDDWASWYAQHLIDRGLRDHLPAERAPNVDELASMLTRLDLEYQQEQTTSAWPDVYARGILNGMA